MIAAIYARKSTEQSVADDQKSVARQLAHAREYAARKGWTVDEACLFVDDGISGAEFAKRPGFVRLMNALKPRPSFDVLVMSEESRLGREAIETAYALKQIISANVRVFFYLEDRERTLDSPIEKAMLALQTMADEMEREKARQRMVDTMMRKARAGHVTGGKCFGYDNLEILDAGRRSHVEQRINEREAATIRRVFELAADGVSQIAIAKQLNAEGAPAPSSQQGRPRAWAPSSVHEALFRPRYRGELVWNRTKKRDRWGQHRVSARGEGEWIRVPAPHLRIVSEDVWRAAHAKIAAARDRTTLIASPRRSKYLLPGLARCAWCEGGLHVRQRTRERRQADYFYACTSHYNRGESVCRNVVQLPMGDVDRKVLGAIGNIVTPDLVDDIVARVRDLVTPAGQSTQRDRLLEQLGGAERQVENLADAIARGGNIPALVARLQNAEQARQALAQRVDELGAGVPLPRVDLRILERQARRLMGEWRALLTRHVVDACELLRALMRDLLEGPIRFTPTIDGDRRGAQFEGAVAIGGILAGNVEVMRLASPAGIGPLLPAIQFAGDIVILQQAS